MNDAYQNEIAKACVTIYPGLHTAHASEKMELPLKFLATGTRVHTPSIFPRDSLIQPVPLQARRVSTAFRSLLRCLVPSPCKKIPVTVCTVSGTSLSLLMCSRSPDLKF